MEGLLCLLMGGKGVWVRPGVVKRMGGFKRGDCM